MPELEEINFKLSKDFKKGEYCFLIRVKNWAIELQKSELASLYYLLLKINKQVEELSDHLMEEELINLEIEQLPWYIELEGNKNDWSLRLVFESQEKLDPLKCIGLIPIAKNLFYEIKNVGINGLKNK